MDTTTGANGCENYPKLKVAIVGGGLVGTLSASFFAKRGHEVHLYELRPDIRHLEHVPGRSINLALSIRGRAALKEVGIEEQVVQRHGIPMFARMIHNLDGTTKPIPYGKKDQCIYSVGRRFLNEALLTAAEKYSNVHCHFNEKLVSANLNQGKMTFERQPNKEVHNVEAQLVVGADGAFSSVRRQMMKQPLFDFSQTYIPHGYLELCIPPLSDGSHAMPKNYLHIWPRGRFMMIALPNQDGSWTVTLFMPFEEFGKLSTPEKLLDFFQQYYPDALPLIGKEKLVSDYFAYKPSPLVSVKCGPYNIGDTAIIIGDAAHAMVPFYGQGMNAGFEDCRLLDAVLLKHNFDLGPALIEFSKTRRPDAEAICNLAMYNYVEMRDLVNRKTFLIRKHFDNLLHTLMPDLWIPLYTSVTFSHMPYAQCIKNKEWQDKMVDRFLSTMAAVVVAMIAYFVYSFAF
ncbi:kynurenine 3-monooxygenase [Neocloeon triangulifer]|uniref:kynurenine 3-monooxygenase n=1 Tax=Neocloeon triangulifer TaxID=2078957 RepID=UPI00286F906A|nr:kynurenine 3-monooxygenase [Neocloeon triangulifer]